MKLLSVGTNAKTAKSDALGEYITAIMYLAPAKVSGVNLCKYAGECAKTCLFYAGRGAFPAIQAARIAKTRFFLEQKIDFQIQLVDEIRVLEKQAKRAGKKLAVRLNGTSDIPWERVMPGIFTEFPDVQFYDYTKYPPGTRLNLPSNYRLTYSYSERSAARDVPEAVRYGMNVAVVFNGKALPKTWKGMPVIDGDLHDLRFQDSKGVTVGLLAKGKAKTQSTRFVQKVIA